MSAVTIPAQGTGTTTPDVATDEIAGQHHQKMKLGFGGTGTATPVTETTPFPVTSKTVLTSSAPVAISVGATSGAAVAANASRKGLVLVNTHATAIISFGFGANAAVLYSGITLYPNGGSFEMDEYTFTTEAVNAISSVAGANLAGQEMV